VTGEHAEAGHDAGDCCGTQAKLRSHDTSPNRSSLRRRRPLVGRPPTGASSCRSITTATSFRDG
jgi:hypothetical protein